ncbi:MAG: FAD-dependent oxidoreductase [Candidatus Kariarchaeaceae archaeon]
MTIYKPSDITKDRLTVDVCIIGSGCGGAISAAKLSKQGYSVVLLEKGPYVDKTDFDQNSTKLIKKMYVRSAGLATDDMSIRILQGSVYGGSSTINWMACLRPPTQVLEEWGAEYGLIEYAEEEMIKHFEEVEGRINAHIVPDGEQNQANRVLLDGCKELGIHVECIQNNSKDCIGCGTCGLGCPYDAKMDMRLTYLQDALDNGVTIFTETRADKIKYLSKETQHITATILGKGYDLNDRKLTITSRRLIVAAGAMNTPLLLQKSKLTKGGNVGKYFQIHPVSASFAFYDRVIDPTYGIPLSSACKEYSDLNGQGYGFWLEMPDLEPFLAGVNLPGIGPMRRQFLTQLRNVAVMLVLVRDGANKKSNGEIKWRRGFNRQNGSFNFRKVPSIRYKLSDVDKEHLMKGIEESIKVQFAAGATNVLTLHSEFTNLTSPEEISKIKSLKNGSNEITIFSAHPMGTARMGKDPKVSVIDETMQMHYYPGVYVMDSSVLPTALGVNPMITILSTISRALELGNLGFD